MKRHFCFKIFMIAGILSLGPGTVSWGQSTDVSSDDLKAFADRYRQEKKIQHRENIRKALSPQKPVPIQKTLEAGANNIYAEAFKAFHQKDYDVSKEKLEQLKIYLTENDLSSSFKKISHMRINNLLQKIENKERQENRAHKKKIVSSKKESLTEKTPQMPVYAEIETAQQQEMISQLRRRQKEIQAQREAVQRTLNRGIETMYKQGMAYYQKKDYWQAKMVFEDIQRLSPDYKEITAYLKRIQEFLKSSNEKDSAS